MMATSWAKMDSSDEIFEFVCTPCSKAGRNNEAMKYCADCQEYLCGTCLQYHNTFAIMAGHNLVGKANFGKAGTYNHKTLQAVPTERCELHSLKLVDMYCVEHNSIGCHVCFIIKHKSCTDIHYIPEYIQTHGQPFNKTKAGDEIQKEILKLEDLIQVTRLVMEEKQNQKAINLQLIKDFRSEVDAILDRLEQATIANLKDQHAKVNDILATELTTLQETLDSLHKRLAEMTSSGTNQSQQFVSSKLSQKLISTAEAERSTFGPADAKKIVQDFKPNPNILDTLHDLSVLGDFKTRGVNLYEVAGEQSFDISHENDKKECDIWSSFLLESGDILLADYNNCNIKLINGKIYSIKSILKLPSKPLAVCVVSSAEVAVTLCNQTLQFVSVSDRLTISRSLTFDHTCRGIAVVNGNLMIGSDNRKELYVYTIEGKLMKTIVTDESGNEIFRKLRNLCVSTDGSMIHLTDWNKGLITMNMDGSVLWRYDRLKSIWGMTTDSYGNVFVSDCVLNTVVQIGPNGQYKGEVVARSLELASPQACCFDAKSSKLIVACANENMLHIFTLRSSR